MSFEIYLQCFDKGERAGISRQQIRDVFGDCLNDRDSQCWYLQYDEQNACEMSIDPLSNESELIHSFSVHRPCGDERLWDSVFKIMTLGHVFLYYPGGDAPMVADEIVLDHLPSGLLGTLGTPVRVRSGAEILQRIAG